MRRALALALVAGGLSASAATGAEIDTKAGESIAHTYCAACHDVGPTQAHAVPPTFFELAQDPATTETSLRFLLTHPHEAMPNLRLNADETAEIIAYVLSLRQRAR